jgi:hypothetical protein
MPVTANAAFVGKCIGHGLTQCYTDILHGVVGIDMQIALCLDVKIQHPVSCHLVKHVFQERQPGGEFASARAIQVYGNANLRLQGVPLDRGLSSGHEQLPFRSEYEPRY